jgi:hypothetical protein
MFGRNMSPPSSGYKNPRVREVLEIGSHTSVLFDRGYLYPEDGGDMFLRNIILTRPTLCHIPENFIV